MAGNAAELFSGIGEWWLKGGLKAPLISLD